MLSRTLRRCNSLLSHSKQELIIKHGIQMDRTRTFHTKNHPRILVTGASGQIGSEMVPYLRSNYGYNNVISSDIHELPKTIDSNCVFTNYRQLSVLDESKLNHVIEEEEIDTIVHLAAILSASGEKNPLLTLKVNNDGVQNILEAARIHELKVFCPSTIAVFGSGTHKTNTPDDSILKPQTIYGITKVHAELLGTYYYNHFNVDFRSLRYPGVISALSKPGGGTTDYAVEVFHDAVTTGSYTCFLERNTKLPMMYMPDVLRGTLELMNADSNLLSRRVYNFGSMSFTPEELAKSISAYKANFSIKFKPDFRQSIADSWPQSIDYSIATKDWGWCPTYDLESTTKDVLTKLTTSYEVGEYCAV